MQPWATTADPEPQEQLMGTPSVSNVSAAVVARDRTCILTGEVDSLDRAHIFPRSAQEWFHKNRMQRYNDRQDSRQRACHEL
jgi:altronate dehydratase